jgi:hypothetical protein
MEDRITLQLLNNAKKIPVVMTYGLHKELQMYLFEENRLFNIFTDPEVGDEIFRLCLAERDELGNIVGYKITQKDISGVEIQKLLDFVFNYFEKFFLNSQAKIQAMTNRLNQISKQSAE